MINHFVRNEPIVFVGRRYANKSILKEGLDYLQIRCVYDLSYSIVSHLRDLFIQQIVKHIGCRHVY